MANVVQSASEKRYGIFEQATWGTGAVAGSAFEELQFEHLSIPEMLNNRRAPAANGVRFLTDNELDIDNKEQASVIPYTINDVSLGSLDHFLYNWFQNVVEGATAAVFPKTFTLPLLGTTQQPDFSSDAGHFFSLCERYTTASQSWLADDCISSSLTLSAEPGGRLNLSGELMARDTISHVFNPTGTWTLDNGTGLHYSDMVRATIDYGGGATTSPFKGQWEIVLTQTLTKVGFASGTFANWGLTERSGTFSLNMQKDVNTQTALANAAAGTAITVNLGWGSATAGTASGDFDITFRGKLTEPVVADNEPVLGTVLTGEIVASATNASPITIILANGVDRAW